MSSSAIDPSPTAPGEPGEAESDDEHAAPAALPAAGESASEAPGATFVSILRDTFFVFDRRTLGFSRILLGFMLLCDVFHRGRVWNDMYSSIGVLPTHVNLQRPLAWGAWSIFNGFETPPELAALWCVMFVTYLCLFLGYKTKFAQILSMVFVVSMNGRVLLIENGGYVVHNLLAMWTCFLPMGDRFSLDALLRSMKLRREATAADLNDRSELIPAEKRSMHATIFALVLCFQVGAIYFFNVLHKTGPAWHNGTAVHYVLYVDRMVTPIVGVIRDHIPNIGIQILTRMTMLFEMCIPFLLFSTFLKVWARRVAIVMINALHIGFGSFMVLGPFAWACCIFSTLFFSKEDWDIAAKTMRREHRARTVLYDRDSGAALWVCRLLARFDNFDLLTFREADVPTGIATEDADGTVRTRAEAAGELVDALPLGPFVAWMATVPGPRHALDWALERCENGNLSRWFGLTIPSKTVHMPPRSTFGRYGAGTLAVLREVGVLVMFVGAVNQAAVELWVINRRFKVPQPEPTRLLSLKLRFLQGWFMFSPNPVMDDGTLVVDATTIDGRHIDPFTQKAPSFELLHVKSYGYSQIWCDYYNRIHLPSNSGYRDAMKDYMYRLPARTGNPKDEIVSGDVYWIQDMNPRWNDTRSYQYEKQKLFSFTAPGHPAAPPPNEGPASGPHADQGAARGPRAEGQPAAHVAPPRARMPSVPARRP